MATRLKTPITITIEHVENAVWFAMMNQNGAIADISIIHGNAVDVHGGAVAGEMGRQIESQLKAQGIDWNTWLPPEPIRIATHEVTTLESGSLRIGCTVVTREEILKAKELSDAGVGKEGEWPRYFYRGNYLVRAKSLSDCGDYYSSFGGVWQNCFGGGSVTEWAANNKVPQITREEASKIAGGNL